MTGMGMDDEADKKRLLNHTGDLGRVLDFQLPGGREVSANQLNLSGPDSMAIALRRWFSMYQPRSRWVVLLREPKMEPRPVPASRPTLTERPTG